MKVFGLAIAAMVLCAGTFAIHFNTAQAEAGSHWVCKTAPIWNGRARGVRYTTGATQEQARSQAVALCQYSGYADYCISQIACWQE